MLNTITETLRWTTVKHGAKAYVDAFVQGLPKNHHVHVETKIRSVRREKNHSVSLIFEDETVENFDHVVFAVHANQALSILGDEATDLESQTLGSFRTSGNEIALHLDPTVSLLFSPLCFDSFLTPLPGPADQQVGLGSLEWCDTKHAKHHDVHKTCLWSREPNLKSPVEEILLQTPVMRPQRYEPLAIDPTSGPTR